MSPPLFRLFSKSYRAIALAIILPLPAMAATYYTSTSGNDANDGLSEATTWQTINKVNSVEFPDNSTILFKRGEVFRGAISALKFPKGLTFGAYGTGDNPVIAGSVAISGWKSTTNSTLTPQVYEADVSTLPLTEKGIEQLYVNGELMTIARYPNVDSPAAKNWLKVGASAGKTSFTDPALVAYGKPDNYWTGATLRIRNYSWTYVVSPITGYQAATGKITATGLSDQLPEWGYFIDGKLEELNFPGEWYYDVTAKKVYLYPKAGVDLNTVVVEGSTYENGLSVSTQENNTVAENLTFRHFTNRGASITGSDNPIIRNCRFEHNGTSIYIWNAANALISHNTIDHSLESGIILQAQKGFVVQNSVAENNQITNTAMYPVYGVRSDGVYQGIGINIAGSGYTVRQNTVEKSSHAGIFVTNDGYHLVEQNTIRNALLLLNDGGALVINSDGNTIRQNLIFDAVGNIDESNGCGSMTQTPCAHHSSYGMGIGSNPGFKDNVIDGNTIANNPDIGIRLNAFVNTIVRNNVLYNNDPQIAIEDKFGPSKNNLVEGNVIYSLRAEQLGLSLQDLSHSEQGTFDKNFYCNPYSEVLLSREKQPYALAHWQSQFAYEKNSRQCDIQLSEYTITNPGPNLILNSTFDTEVTNWNDSGNAKISYDPSQALLDGGSLKAIYQGASGNANVIPNSFNLVANQNYRLKFSVVGNGFGNINLTISDTTPNNFQNLVERNFAYDTSRQNYEFIFQSPLSTTAGKVFFITRNYDANTYWLDNVTLESVTPTLNDAKQQVVLFSNPAATPLTVELGKTYFDADGKAVTGSLTLTAFSAKVLTTNDTTPVLPPTTQSVALTVAKVGSGSGTVTTSPGTGAGINCGATCTETYNSGTVVTLTATPATASTFVGWSGTGCGNTLTITAATTCSANFALATAPNFAITVALAGTGAGTVISTPAGIDCGGQCTQTYPQSTEVTLTATPQTNSTFSGWAGHCAGTNPVATVTLAAAKTCTATFEVSATPPPVVEEINTLVVTKVGKGTVTSTPAGIDCGNLCTTSYDTPTAVTLTATPDSGVKLVGFSGDADCADGQVTLANNITVNCTATFEIVPPPPTAFYLATCPLEGVINEICRGYGKTMTVTIEKSGYVSDAVFAGSIASKGWVSNVTISNGATLTGGVVTGYITNQGTMANFKFVGAKLTGGTLAGAVTNASKVGGVIMDVSLAPNASLTGGKLQGTIKGDLTAPAKLENVRVLAGSHLSGVVLGNKVVLEKGVTVETETPPTPPTPPTPATDTVILPDLGGAVASDANGNAMTTTTQFTGGIAVNGGKTFAVTQELSKLQEVADIRGNITTEAAQVGQIVDILVYAAYQVSPEQLPVSLMLNTTGGYEIWDGKPSSLIAFQKAVTLSANQEVQMYKGVLIGAGILQINFGYRLPDGTVVQSNQSLEVTIKE